MTICGAKLSHECRINDYHRAESWCREIIASGNEMMFSLRLFHEEIGRASDRFGLSFVALHSLFRNAHVTHMKRTSHSFRSQTMRHVKSYLNGTSLLALARKCNVPPSSVARLIVENIACFPSSAPSSSGTPSDSHGNNTTSSTNNAPRKGGAVGGANSRKKFVTEALRHPEKMLGCASASVLPEYLFSEKNGATNKRGRTLIDSFSNKPFCVVHKMRMEDHGNENVGPLSRLSLEVREAVDSDPLYGPKQDRERHNVGIEYELLLEQTLRSMEIPFETEAELRVRGTARTPDILLSAPVGLKVRRKESQIRSNSSQLECEESLESQQKHCAHNLNEVDEEFEWKIICWIDSKALFGDVETHTNSVLPQVETYVHRFGPGLVLYWFGHAPLSLLGDSHGDVVIVGGNVPELLLMPTGEFHGRGGVRYKLGDAM